MARAQKRSTHRAAVAPVPRRRALRHRHRLSRDRDGAARGYFAPLQYASCIQDLEALERSEQCLHRDVVRLRLVFHDPGLPTRLHLSAVLVLAHAHPRPVRVDGDLDRSPVRRLLQPVARGSLFFHPHAGAAVSYSRPVANRRLRHAVTIVFALVLVRHIYWTASSYAYDATSAMTGSGAAAKYIREHHLDRTRLYGAGVRCIEVQPYFASNVFGNQRTQGGASFWDFSERNPWPYPGWLDRERTRWMNLELAQRPDYMLVATGFGGDIFFSAMMSRRTDYPRIPVFP